jgi:ribosomal-protein-alanine N-acetyltransferase
VTARRARPLTAADLDAVAAIEREVFTDPWSNRAFGDLLGLDHVRGFVVEDGKGVIVGYAVCSQVADEGEILNLATAPGARRKGIGRALLAAVLQWLGERGAVKVFLEVRRSNEAAIAMYEAAGFATLGVRPNYYRRPTEDAVTMVLEGASGNARK